MRKRIVKIAIGIFILAGLVVFFYPRQNYWSLSFTEEDINNDVIIKNRSCACLGYEHFEGSWSDDWNRCFGIPYSCQDNPPISGDGNWVPPKVESFTECASQGYPVQESYPRKCSVGEDTYTEIITNANTNTTVSTAGWKTYTNQKYDFSLKHPTTWTSKVYTSGYNNEGDYVIAFSIPQSSLPAPFLAVKVNSTLDKELARIKAANINPKISAIETVTVGTVTAKQFSYTTDIGITREDTVITRGNDLYIFNFQVDDANWPQVIASLAFLDETAGWKTYTNTRITYSLKLPGAWSPVGEYDGAKLPLIGDSPMVSFVDTSSKTANTGFSIQACSLTSTDLCVNRTLDDWKATEGFVLVSDENLRVTGFEVGRDRNGFIRYVRKSESYFVYVYLGDAAGKTERDILSTFTFTK